MLSLQRLLGIHLLDFQEIGKSAKPDNSTTKYLNIFEGTLEEAVTIAEESNGFLLLIFHDPHDADSRDFFQNILLNPTLVEFLSNMSFKRLITMTFDISNQKHFHIAQMFGIHFCPAVVVKIKLQSKFQTVLSHEGYIEASMLCGAFQSLLLAAEAEYAQSEELKATRSLQSEQDEAYRRSVEADLEKRKSRSFSPIASGVIDSDPNSHCTDLKLAERIQAAKEAMESVASDIQTHYRIQFVLPDGGKNVASFGFHCTAQDLFNYLFASELLTTTNVLIRSIEPSFEVKDFENEKIVLNDIENLGKTFKLFVEYY